MSRFYTIVVGEGKNATVWTNKGPNGTGAILGAQTVELDLLVAQQHAPDSGAQSFFRIWGPTREQISQASNFNGQPVTIYGGMQSGLPLASASAGQSGVLITGTVFSAFGNYQGTNQTLDMIINPNGNSSTDKPANIVHFWPKGTPLATAIKSTLGAAFPAWTINVDISPNLVLASDDHGIYPDIGKYAKYINRRTKPILGPKYSGVTIVSNTGSTTINVTDNSKNPSKITAINGNDLIGQITWLDLNTIQFTTVMRSDIQIADGVSFPKYVFSQAQTTSASNAQSRSAITFTGNFGIGRVQHFGNSRDPDGQSWVSSYQAFALTPD